MVLVSEQLGKTLWKLEEHGVTAKVWGEY